jgi:protein transport protein SEC61 subunit alpha
MNLISTATIFAAVIYLHGFRIEIPVKSNRFRANGGCIPSSSSIRAICPERVDE